MTFVPVSIFLASLFFLLYADDIKIYRTVSNVNDSIFLQSDLDSIGSWCSKNSLPLNLNKCHIVRYAKRPVTIPSTYHINNHPLSVLNEIVDLGVLFDDKFLMQCSALFSETLYYSTICIPDCLYTLPWSVQGRICFLYLESSGSVQINSIERLQKKVLKFALQSLHFTEPAPPYDSQCSLLHNCSLKDRRATASRIY